MNRHLINYLPDAVKASRIFDKLMCAETPEFELKWNALTDVKNNAFVELTNINGIQRYEYLLHITPNANDTLESRRKRVLTRLNHIFVYDWQSLIKQVKLIYGDDAIEAELNVDSYQARLNTHINVYRGVDEVYALFRRTLSSNIALDVYNTLDRRSVGIMTSASALTQGAAYTLTSDFNTSYNLMANVTDGTHILEGVHTILS